MTIFLIAAIFELYSNNDKKLIQKALPEKYAYQFMGTAGSAADDTFRVNSGDMKNIQKHIET